MYTPKLIYIRDRLGGEIKATVSAHKKAPDFSGQGFHQMEKGVFYDESRLMLKSTSILANVCTQNL